MIRIGLYSEDPKLQQILSSVLGKEFQVLLESTEEGINRMLAAAGCDVVILDLDSNHDSLQHTNRLLPADRWISRFHRS